MTYAYKLYRTKRTAQLDAMLREACFVWNHALALQKRYYRLYGKYIPIGRMKHHFVLRIRRRLLHSQTVQELLERLDASYKRFFSKLSRRPPKFRKARDFSSFVYKQGGYSLSGNSVRLNSIGKTFRFSLSRPWEGNVKQVRIRRDRCGDYFVYVVTDAVAHPCGKTHDGASVGMDFGLKTFLTLSDGTRIENPQFMKRNLSRLRKLSRSLSRCEKGSNHRKMRRLELERFHRRVADSRDDWQWKLCHELCRRYDTICIEDLQLEGMRRLWGRKVGDLAYGAFVEKLGQVSAKYGVTLSKVDRFYPSSRTCSVCGYVNELLSLRDRRWVCPECGTSHDRDLNASVNILRQGIASSGSHCKTVLARQGALATGESPVL